MESNVRGIFDKTDEIRITRQEAANFNQFAQMGNYIWHYNITGQLFRKLILPISRAKWIPTRA